MKVLLLYDYPPSPGGLATQGALLHKGLQEIGIEVHSVHFESEIEKEWYYNWFKPDIAVGIGYWGHTPHIIQHPQKHGILAVPWLVADGFIANYQDTLNELPLILVTSNWVKEMYVRDGIKPDNICVLPVGCDTDVFRPYPKSDPKIIAIRKALGISPEQLMILTIGGDAASKGAREIMAALGELDHHLPSYKYICKVWPQPRTFKQNKLDLELAFSLGLKDQVSYVTNITSRNLMPYLIAACDIYAAPSRLEGFGMPQVEASACGKPVLSLKAMGMLDTMIHGETALLAEVAQRIVTDFAILGKESGFDSKHRIDFPEPRTVDYRANIADLVLYLNKLMTNAELREQLGKAGRERVLENFNYKSVAEKFVKIVTDKLNLS